jgi:hypothetical protein
MNRRAVLVGTSMMPSIGQQLWSDRGSFVRALLPPLAIAALLPAAIAKVAPLRRARAILGFDVALVVLLIIAFFGAPRAGGEQGATPDVLYISSMGSLAQARWEHSPEVERLHPDARTPLPLPPLTRARDAVNVVMIVDESVRAMDVCNGYDRTCAVTPATNVAAPKRFAFEQMRSLDSTTAVSLAVLWSGLPPTATRQEFHTVPLLWEYARAAGFSTAYWTSQNLFFANAGLWLEGLPLDKSISATELDPEPTYEMGADDGALVDVVLHDIDDLQEPFVGVVHLSNTHFPYKIDADDAPFQPQSEAVGAGDRVEVTNRYRDAIYRQDKHVGRLVREIRARPFGPRTVVLFISDHGEQIRERGAIGHTDTVQDEEVRTAAWLDAPAGTITEEEASHLRALARVPLTQLDVMPTLLDVMGLADASGVAPFRAKMPGTSLLRGGSSPDTGFVLTNCTELFACAFKNWGAMRGTRKLVATQNDFAWRCYDVASDPFERFDLGEGACTGLRELAEGGGRGAPF